MSETVILNNQDIIDTFHEGFSRCRGGKYKKTKKKNVVRHFSNKLRNIKAILDLIGLYFSLSLSLHESIGGRRRISMYIN